MMINTKHFCIFNSISNEHVYNIFNIPEKKNKNRIAPRILQFKMGNNIVDFRAHVDDDVDQLIIKQLQYSFLKKNARTMRNFFIELSNKQSILSKRNGIEQ